MFFGLRNQERFIFGAYSLAILFLGYSVYRADFGQVILCYAIAFYGYYHWIDKRRFRSFGLIVGQALFIRLLLLFALPLLSDDYYRFIWDGLVQVLGENPYAHTPSATEVASAYMREDLLPQMNSPDYYSIYPPVLQSLWQGISLLVGEHTLGQVILMRATIILADIGVIYIGAAILREMGKSVRTVAVYALNPLVIVELTGNLHFEGLMLFFVLLGIYFLLKWREIWSSWWRPFLGSLAIAFGVLTKMVLLLSLPAMLRNWGWWRTLLVGLLSCGFISFGFALFLDAALLDKIGGSFDLYFRNFEFNASLFNLSEHIASHWIPDYTVKVIGPYLMLAMTLSIVLIAIFRKANSIQGYFETLLFILFVHLLFSSTVHPWYVVNLVGVSMFVRHRFAVVWSFLVVLSYHMYALDYHEVWWVLVIEYALLGLYFIYEQRTEFKSRLALAGENP